MGVHRGPAEGPVNRKTDALLLLARKVFRPGVLLGGDKKEEKNRGREDRTKTS